MKCPICNKSEYGEGKYTFPIKRMNVHIKRQAMIELLKTVLEHDRKDYPNEPHVQYIVDHKEEFRV